MNSGKSLAGEEATLQYFQGEYHVVKRGGFVICAVSGAKVSINDLKYWSADLQEPYATAQIAAQRYADWQAGKVTAPEGMSK